MTDRLSPETVAARARSAVDKIDMHGKRCVTLCSMDEIEALALIAVASGLLPPRGGEGVTETPMFKTRRKTS